MLFVFFVLLAVLAPQVLAACPAPSVNGSAVREGYCATTWASDLPNPRALVLAPNGDILVVLADVSRIAAMWEDPITGAIQSVTLVGRSGLNHALRLHNGWLYASSATTIFRWPYSAPEQMRVPFGSPEVVLTDMPPTGIFGHLSRTMVFDAAGRMYVNVGSDGDSSTVPNRAAVWRYNVYGSTLPLQWPRDGEVFANGTRNSVGLCFDRWGRLWSPENGSDALSTSPGTRTDLGDIQVLNPGEEVNLFLEENMHRYYGFPDCWSEGPTESRVGVAFPGGLGTGTQWALNPQPGNPITDAWCRNLANNIPPVYVTDSHTAPLDMLFYYGDAFENGSINGKVAFLTRRGPSNRPPTVGRSVDMLLLDADGKPYNQVPLFYPDPPGWPLRPVAMLLRPCKNFGGVMRECLMVSQNRANAGSIIAIAYIGNSEEPCQGCGLFGRYYPNRLFRGATVVERVDPIIDFDWTAAGPAPGVLPTEIYGVRWTGTVTAPHQTGEVEYTFTTISDDGCRLWIDNVLLLDRWWPASEPFESWATVTLSAGIEHRIRLEYSQRYNTAVIRLLWSSANLLRQVIPQSALRPDFSPAPPPGEVVPPPTSGCVCCGLTAGYYNNRLLRILESPVVSRIDRRIDFNWTGTSPSPGLINSEIISARWQGFIVPLPTNTEYRIYVTGDDGFRLYLGGDLVIDEWVSGQGTIERFVDASFAANEPKSIELQWQQKQGPSEIHLAWESNQAPLLARQIIPDVNLKPLDC